MGFKGLFYYHFDPTSIMIVIIIEVKPPASLPSFKKGFKVGGVGFSSVMDLPCLLTPSLYAIGITLNTGVDYTGILQSAQPAYGAQLLRYPPKLLPETIPEAHIYPLPLNTRLEN